MRRCPGTAITGFDSHWAERYVRVLLKGLDDLL